MGKFISAFDISPVALDEILEEEGTGEACVILEIIGGGDLEE